MVSGPASAEEQRVAAGRPTCCHKYHEAVELIGKRWTGAILFVLMDGPLRFSQVKALVPVRVEYGLTDKGADLEPVVRSLKGWARAWL